MCDFIFQFAMYNPVTDTVEVNTGTGTALFIHCKDFNATVILDDPNDIVYLYHVAVEQPLTYASPTITSIGSKLTKKNLKSDIKSTGIITIYAV